MSYLLNNFLEINNSVVCFPELKKQPSLGQISKEIKNIIDNWKETKSHVNINQKLNLHNNILTFEKICKAYNETIDNSKWYYVDLIMRIITCGLLTLKINYYKPYFINLKEAVSLRKDEDLYELSNNLLNIYSHSKERMEFFLKELAECENLWRSLITVVLKNNNAAFKQSIIKHCKEKYKNWALETQYRCFSLDPVFEEPYIEKLANKIANISKKYLCPTEGYTDKDLKILIRKAITLTPENQTANLQVKTESHKTLDFVSVKTKSGLVQLFDINKGELGEGFEGRVVKSVELLSGKEGALKISFHEFADSKIEDGFKLMQAVDQQGIEGIQAGAISLITLPSGRKAMFSDLYSYSLEVICESIDFETFKYNFKRLLSGLKSLEDRNEYHIDITLRNILVKTNKETGKFEFVLADLSSVFKVTEPPNYWLQLRDLRDSFLFIMDRNNNLQNDPHFNDWKKFIELMRAIPMGIKTKPAAYFLDKLNEFEKELDPPIPTHKCKYIV